MNMGMTKWAGSDCDAEVQCCVEFAVVGRYVDAGC